MEAAPEPRPSQWEKRLTGSPAATILRPPVPGVCVLLRRDSRHRPREPTRLHAALTLTKLSVFHVAVGLLYLVSLLPDIFFCRILTHYNLDPNAVLCLYTAVTLRGFLNNPDCLMITSCAPKASRLLLISSGRLCDSGIRDFKHGRLQGHPTLRPLTLGPQQSLFLKSGCPQQVTPKMLFVVHSPCCPRPLSHTPNSPFEQPPSPQLLAL